MKIDIQKINGKEVIDFLNAVTREDRDELCDISITVGSFVLEKQELKGDDYHIYFSADYNNWGTRQTIEDNHLCIYEDGVQFNLEEPFEGDGTDDALTEVLLPWLETHVFVDSNEKTNKFNRLVKKAYEELRQISIEDKADMDKIIGMLTEAKAWM